MDSIDTAGREAFCLGAVRVEPARNLLLSGSDAIRLEPKVMDVLVALAEADGDVVPREVLIERVWNVEFGGDESVSRAVSLLRKALKDAGLGDKAIETVPKRGYRLALAATPAATAEEAITSPENDRSAQHPTAPKRGLQIAALLAALTIVALATAAFVIHGPKSRETETPVVAVLPFDDQSENGDQKWFADGLADELIDNLARASNLTVLSRTSSFRFANSDLDSRVIGDQLGARYIVSGGVRRDGDSFRISASLVDSKNRATIWSKTYARDSSAIFETQAAIATDIATALNARLRKHEIEAILERTDNPQAFDAFLLGHAFLRAEGSDNIKRAVEQFRLAIKLDPEFIEPMYGLENALSVYDFWRPEEYAAAKIERRQIIDSIEALQPRNNGVEFYRGWYLFDDGDAPAAMKSFAAVEPNHKPGDCDFHAFLNVVTLGRQDAAFIDCVKRNVAADPYSLATTQDAQYISYILGNDDFADQEYERSKTLPGGPGLGEIHAMLRTFAKGDRAAAKKHFRAMIDFLPAHVSQFEAVYENFEDDSRALELLNEARVDPTNQDPTRLIMIAKLLAIYGDPQGAADALNRHFLQAGGTWWPELWTPEHSETRKQEAFKEIIRGKKLDVYFRESGEWNSFCRPISSTDFECF